MKELVEGVGEANALEQVVTQEELDRLTVPEGISDLDRARRYLESGEATQLRVLVAGLAGLVREAGRAAWRTVAAVAEQLSSLDDEVQQEVAQAYATLGRERLLPPAELAELLPAALSGLATQRHPELHAAWLACLHDLAPALEPQVLRSKLLPMVLARGPGGSVGLPTRCLACELLGVVAPLLPREELERTVIRAAGTMCQDTEWQVRRAMCEQLAALGAAAAGTARPSQTGAARHSQTGATRPSMTGTARPSQTGTARHSQSGVARPSQTGAAAAAAVASTQQHGSQQLPLPPAAEALVASVLEEALQLTDDEEVLVRAPAWRAVTSLLPLLGADLRRRQVLPALLRQCQLPDRHVEMQRSLAGCFGELAARLLPECSSEAEATACLALFRSLAAREDMQTRVSCADALPGVLRGAGARRYSTHLHEALQALASDAEPSVRLAAAGQLHVVAGLLGRDRCSQYLRQMLGALLRDEDSAVAHAVVAGLQQTLPMFAPPPSAPTLAPPQQQQQQQQAGPAEDGTRSSIHGGGGGVSQPGGAPAAAMRGCGEFVEPLLRLESLSGHDWRLQLGLLRVIGEGGGNLFPPDAMSDRLAGLALRYMAEGPAVLRAPAAEAAAEAWRAARRPAARTSIYARAVREFAHGRGCWARVAFVDFCCAALRRFSSRFFKAHLLEACLCLAFDPVACVRLALCAAMPALKQVVALPDDVGLLERLNSAMSHLITDRDGEVARAARKANEEFKRLHVRMPCNTLEGSSAGAKAYEAADAARSEAERDWVVDPEGWERVRAEIEARAAVLRPQFGSGTAAAGGLGQASRPLLDLRGGLRGEAGAASGRAGASSRLKGMSAGSSPKPSANSGSAASSKAGAGGGGSSTGTGKGAGGTMQRPNSLFQRSSSATDAARGRPDAKGPPSSSSPLARLGAASALETRRAASEQGDSFHQVRTGMQRLAVTSTGAGSSPSGSSRQVARPRATLALTATPTSRAGKPSVGGTTAAAAATGKLRPGGSQTPPPGCVSVVASSSASSAAAKRRTDVGASSSSSNMISRR